MMGLTVMKRTFLMMKVAETCDESEEAGSTRGRGAVRRGRGKVFRIRSPLYPVSPGTDFITQFPILSNTQLSPLTVIHQEKTAWQCTRHVKIM